MTEFTNTALKGLDSLLGVLEASDLTRVNVRGFRFRGASRAEVISGNDRRNTVTAGRGDDVILGKGGNDVLSGDAGKDMLFGGHGNDRLNGGNGRDMLFGGMGDDILKGDGGNDTLDGGMGIDMLEGGAGGDTLVGGTGVDTLTGGAGIDKFVFNGDPFANGAPAFNPAAAVQLGVSNLPDAVTDFAIGEDKIVVDTQDFGISGMTFQKGTAATIGDGNLIVLTDSFAAAGGAARAIANNTNVTSGAGIFAYFNTTLNKTRLVYSSDLANGGDISVLANLDNQTGAAGLANIANFSVNDFVFVNSDGAALLNRLNLTGTAGNDSLTGGDGDDTLAGGEGVDTLIGNGGSDRLVGGAGQDILTGSAGRDQFAYNGNVFANGTPAPAGTTGINALNTPDTITDFTIAEDQFLLDAADLGIGAPLTFVKGASGQLATNGNVIVLTDQFAAAGGAARAIANNANITAEEGVFVYFNNTIGKTRLVYSENLGAGGDISVLANLDNQTGAAGLAATNSFSATNFALS